MHPVAFRLWLCWNNLWPHRYDLFFALLHIPVCFYFILFFTYSQLFWTKPNRVIQLKMCPTEGSKLQKLAGTFVNRKKTLVYMLREILSVFNSLTSFFKIMIHFGKWIAKVILVEVLLLFIVPDWLRWFNLFILQQGAQLLYLSGLWV